MPKIIPVEVKHKLKDKNWLIDQHVVQLYSIVELSKLLHVTPATVTKALRLFNIVSPSQQTLREASNKRKYGVSNPGAVKEFKQKATNTMIERYGRHNWSKSLREKRDNTCLKLYGNINVGKTEYAKNKARETNLIKYGRIHINQNHISKEVLKKLDSDVWLYNEHVLQQKSLSQIATELGFNDDITTVMNRMRKYNINTCHFQHSQAEHGLVEFLESLNITNIVTNTRSIISPQELDIYLPEYKLAIEYCGLYWHGERFKQRLYHRNKMNACNKLGIRLLTIFEDEWLNTTTLVKQKLTHILNKNTNKVYARKCKIIELTSKEKRDFLNQNHIQQNGPGSINYGLTFNNHLIAVISFIKQKNNCFILNRYATEINVVGGFSKLLEHFKRNINWGKIITFADLRWSNGKLYEQTGFILDDIIQPEYQYIINNRTVHKFNYRRKYLSLKLKSFNSDLSEWENCKANNIDRIWDCGKKRYIMSSSITS